MNTRFFRWSTALLCLLFLNSPATAHQQKTAVTKILFNPNTGNIEVMHRYFLHDAEHGAQLLFGQEMDLQGSTDARELFSNYVVNRFSLAALSADGTEKGLEMAYVGSEIDGQFLWVYQELPQLDDVAGFIVVNSVLHDVWVDQSNLVNVERNGNIFSATFLSGADIQTIQLEDS